MKGQGHGGPQPDCKFYVATKSKNFYRKCPEIGQIDKGIDIEDKLFMKIFKKQRYIVKKNQAEPKYNSKLCS